MSTLILLPSIASFTRLVGHPHSQTDFLNSLSWSNLSPSDAKTYWLYSALVPSMVSATLYAISRQLSTGMALYTLFTDQQRGGRGAKYSARFFVAVQGWPVHRNLQPVSDYFSRWKHYISDVVFLAPCHPSAQRLEALLTQIESEEASFLHKMTRIARRMGGTEFQGYLVKRIAERYSSSGHTQRLSWSTSMPALYASLQKMVQVAEGASQQATDDTPRAAVLTFTDACAARIVADHTRYMAAPTYQTTFLGSQADHLLLHNLAQSWSRAEWSKVGVRLVLVALIALWTLPMAATGGLSQLASFLQIIGNFRMPKSLLGVLQGVLPSIATSMLLSIFPTLLRYIVDKAHHATTTARELTILKYHFMFLFIQLFLVASIGSALLPTLFELLNAGVVELPRILARNLPLAGNYYMSYILIQGFSLAASTLLPWKHIVGRLWSRATAKTPRQRQDAAGSVASQLHWGDLYAFYSILAVLVLVYSILTPMILPIAALTFGIADICSRYSLLYTANIVVDTEGQLYRNAMFKMFIGLYTYQATFIGLFVLKSGSGSKWQNTGQLLVLLLTLICCTQVHLYLLHMYTPVKWSACLNPEVPVGTVESASEWRGSPAKLGPNSLTCIDARHRVVWLPGDEFGIGDAMINAIQDCCLTVRGSEIRVTNLESDVALDYWTTAHE
ncbi:hypothetical protein LTR64_008722 [Lithohypha guttulata]|uniref:uncharacterized protein n=1 Tax=Lithohypha guttulata TaxID=1690604 RepID=UPI00315C8A38